MSKAKKQLPLRLSQDLYEQIASWAEDDFRSINGQIEYLLTQAIKERRKKDFELEEEEEK
ncbi:MAG: Arc family DNA-binding protein [Tissierellia bacterium]|nr:Arc family DNA-binding protein [Tissierellia bacterium]